MKAKNTRLCFDGGYQNFELFSHKTFGMKNNFSFIINVLNAIVSLNFEAAMLHL